MHQTRIIMAMPVTIEICDASAFGPPKQTYGMTKSAKATTQQAIDEVFSYFTYIDQTFSTFKVDSEITKINKGLILPKDYSPDMKTVFALSEKTKQETNGYFNITNNQGIYDPSGLVKGWAIFNAAQLLKKAGFENFYVEAGGDIQISGFNNQNEAWKVGIKNPFNGKEIVKTVYLNHNEGVATSGNYERGSHIYNPLGRSLKGEAKGRKQQLAEIVSLTVIGKNVYEADRFATAAFAMQKEGINFIETLRHGSGQALGLEGYMIDVNGIATMTSGFNAYTSK